MLVDRGDYYIIIKCHKHCIKKLSFVKLVFYSFYFYYNNLCLLFSLASILRVILRILISMWIIYGIICKGDEGLFLLVVIYAYVYITDKIEKRKKIRNIIIKD